MDTPNSQKSKKLQQDDTSPGRGMKRSRPRDTIKDLQEEQEPKKSRLQRETVATEKKLDNVTKTTSEHATTSDNEAQLHGAFSLVDYT